MELAFYSVKGGQGTSTVACAAALAATTTNVLLIDHTGDCSAIMGLPSEGGTLDGNVTVTLNPNAAFYVDRATTTIIHDCGSNPALAGQSVDKTILVIRSCYLAARRFVASNTKPDGFVFVVEPKMERALTADDIGRVIGAPLIATVPVDPYEARCIDAGLYGLRPLNRKVWSDLIEAVQGVSL